MRRFHPLKLFKLPRMHSETNFSVTISNNSTPRGTMADDFLETAIANWGPRFTANGVDASDYQRLTSSILAWDDWCAAWSARADDYVELGHAALAEGHRTQRRRVLRARRDLLPLREVPLRSSTVTRPARRTPAPSLR